METKANYALIGAFILAGFLGLLGFLMWFAKFEVDRQFDYYDVYFPEVTGLGVASQVRFAGLPVGQVVDMGLTSDGDGRVRVRLEVRQGTPVRRDSAASLEMQGVTGVANIGISAGTPSSPLLREVSTDSVPVIPAARSALQTLGEEAPEMVSRLNEVTLHLTELLSQENRNKVDTILSNIEHATGNLDQALSDISSATKVVADVADSMSTLAPRLDTLGETANGALQRADETLAKITETAGNLDQTLASGTRALDTVQAYVADDLPGLTARLTQSLENLDPVLVSAAPALDAARSAFEGADQIVNTDLGPVISDLRETLTNLNAAITQVNADLPGISQNVSSAAASADAAFASLRGTLEGIRGPVQNFAQEGLPQFSMAGRDIRAVAQSIDHLVRQLSRNPGQLLSGQRQPEFRR
ncbi:MAG: MlaD family protein [Paracoccus sp. (in: a-proteobacteria)]|uniref:MlaD family protein n=1 Tax=Paracoccus sp. TaxID=267 RepID=UPI0026DECD7D|nr:MlaD family protein [Paracoccus sp. (in: a-proteobacteria)]MDO5630707.1 MlaD family protein [Paracoccus sp. (in: a-proteobacteria)]